jgi:Na+-transporting methylmalonyl-CoA/oxaloacetate decarboxylase gamma subunit
LESHPSNDKMGWKFHMDNWTFGMTMTLLGMGGTFLTLGILILFMDLLKRAFPLPEPPGRAEESQKGGGR